MDPVRFSVVIPVYNRQDMVKRALDSVLKQTRKADEVIVVNDGSADNTNAVLKNFADQITVINQSNCGVSAARNAGIKSAKRNWITFLDSDDVWLPNKLLLAEKFILNNPEIKIFQSEEIWIRNGRRVNPKTKHKKITGNIFKESLPLCIISPSAVVIHKTLFEEVGLFDELLPVCEDYDLWLRISQRFIVGLDSTPGVIKYGGHSDQLSTKFWGMDRFRIQALEKLLANSDLPDPMRNLTTLEIVNKLKILITGYEKHGRDTSEFQNKLLHYNQLLEP